MMLEPTTVATDTEIVATGSQIKTSMPVGENATSEEKEEKPEKFTTCQAP